MSDNTELEQRVEELENQLKTLREAQPIQSLPGNTIAFKAFLKGLLAAEVPEERDTFLEVVRGIADADARAAMPIESLTDVDSLARKKMIAVIDAFFIDLSSG